MTADSEDRAPHWMPSAERASSSQMYRFMTHVNQAEGTSFEDYSTLHRWSVENKEKFWAAVWQFADVCAYRECDRVLDEASHMIDARWFVGAELNFAEHLLRGSPERLAIVFRNEVGHRETLTYRELRHEVGRVAAGLRAEGVGVGDRVVGFMPNRPETVVAMLAATSIGAIWSSCSPDFGVPAVVDRFGQVEPKVMFCSDWALYGGKKFPQDGSINALTEQLPSLSRVVIVPYRMGPSGSESSHGQSSHGQSIGPQRAAELRVDYADFGAPSASLRFAPLPFDQPVYILYSSGTTGAPKGIIHGAGGTLLQHQKELRLHVDLRPEETLFYYTTCGWMMWNWLVSALGTGSTILLYDGSPTYPDAAALWRIASEESVHVFGTSAKYLASIEKAGVAPSQVASLDVLRALLSTGSPLAARSYDFVRKAIGRDVQLCSISGGTDIVSCFALGNPLLPVFRGELQCIGLGMDVHVFDEHGRPTVGKKGELVCTGPFPSMPVGFWNDPDRSRYRAAYYERFDGVWCHGDYAEITPRGGMVIYGRSDAVLNPGGVRIGTAEIYRQVDSFDEVLESVAIGQERHDDVRVVLFVKLRNGCSLDEHLRDMIRQSIRDGASPRHVPAVILSVPDIPRTLSGKISEVAVREVVHGRAPRNRGSLANPESLRHFECRAELQSDSAGG